MIKTVTFCFARRAGYRVGPQSRLGTETNAFVLVCQSGEFRVCRCVTRRVHICSHVRIGVFCVSNV